MFGITSNTLAYLAIIHPGQPVAIPAATGWDEELRDRTAEALRDLLGLIHPHARSSLRHQYR